MSSKKNNIHRIFCRTLLLAVMCVMVIAGVFTGCSKEKERAGSINEDNIIKIGANMEMSGAIEALGKSAIKGAQLAINEINTKGGILNGKKLELVIVDNNSDPIKATEVLRELLSKNNIVAVLAPIASSSVIASADVHQEKKVLGISPTASNPTVTVDPATGKTREYVFRAAFIDSFQGLVMANFASKNLQATKALVYIDNNSEYSKGLASFFEDTFIKNGGKIIGREYYFQNDTDFKATLEKIKKINPEVIFLPGYYQEAGLIIKQAHELGIKAPIIGGDGWDSNSLTEIIADDTLTNIYFSTHYSSDDSSPTLKVFVNAYKNFYDEIPDGFAAMSYDATMIIIEAIKRANSTDPIKVRDELAQTKNHKSVSGTITLNERHDAVKSVVIMEVKDGQLVFKEKVNP